MKRPAVFLTVLCLLLVFCTAMPTLAVLGEEESLPGDEISSALPDGDLSTPPVDGDNSEGTEESSTTLYYLIVTAGEGGMVDNSVDGAYMAGDRIELVAEPLEGYVFSHWNADGGVIVNSSSAETQFYMPEGDVTVLAVFVEADEETSDETNSEDESRSESPDVSTAPSLYYTLTVKAGEGGRVNEGVNGAYQAGKRIDLSAEPLEGYIFSKWKSNGGVIANAFSADTEFYMPVGNVTVEAVFVKEGEATSEEDAGDGEESSKTQQTTTRIPYKLLYSLIGLAIFAAALFSVLFYVYFKRCKESE